MGQRTAYNRRTGNANTHHEVLAHKGKGVHMLHIVRAIVEAGLSQNEAKKAVKLAGGIIGKSAKITPETAEKFGGILEVFAKDDAQGTLQSVELGENVHVTVMTGMDMPSIKGLKADLTAFFDSEEFNGLAAKAAKTAKAMVKADDIMTTLDTMTVREFRQHMTVNGGKFTLDRGVASVKMPGMRSTAYFGQDGRILDMGDGSKDSRKAVLDREHAKGKLAYLSGLGKLTASQIDFVADCLIDDELAEYVTPKLEKIVEAKTAKALGK